MFNAHYLAAVNLNTELKSRTLTSNLVALAKYCSPLVSSPCRSHRQHLITSSRRGKFWEIWSRAVPSCKHIVETRRVVPNETFLSCTIRPKAECQSVHKADDRYRSLFTTLGTDGLETGILTVGHRPLCVYHTCRSTWHHRMLPDLLGLPHAVIHSISTGSNQILAVGTAWERGYVAHLYFAVHTNSLMGELSRQCEEEKPANIPSAMSMQVISRS